jgi:CMP-N,N'-diacetyllegionaminic acid synthase
MANRILSIIPARAGSKGIKKKNITNLAGKPLISWTIEASLRSKFITKTIVSSDDSEILEISKILGANTIKRPKNIATDTSSSVSVVSHTIEFLKNQNEQFDVIILLQPTSPLRTYLDIDSAFDLYFNSKATSVISGHKLENKFLKVFSVDHSGYLSTPFNSSYPFMSRQELPMIFMPNGAIYIIDADAFSKLESFYTSKTLSYEMSEENSIDIDLIGDLKLAEDILFSRSGVIL